MKKLFMFIAAMFVITSAVQAGTPVKTSDVFDNTCVSLNVGASATLSSSNWLHDGDRFIETARPTATVRLGKWITPIFGAELQGEVGFGTLNTTTFVDHTYVGANAMLNANNLVHGYCGSCDKVEFIPYAGIGWWHSYGLISNNIATQYGVKVNVNMGKAQNWQLNIVPQITYLLAGDITCQYVHQPHFDSKHAYVGLQVGVTYKFPNHYGTHDFVLCDKVYTQAEMDVVNDEVNRLREVNNNLSVALQSCESCLKESNNVVEVKTEDKVVNHLPRIQFERGSAELSSTSHTSMSQIAEVIKTTTNKWAVLGYASEEGDVNFNKELSWRRARVVKEELVNLGVNEAQLVVEGCGETTKFSQECLELNRVVEICE